MVRPFKVRGQGSSLPHCHTSVQGLVMSQSGGSFSTKSQSSARNWDDCPDGFDEVTLERRDHLSEADEFSLPAQMPSAGLVYPHVMFDDEVSQIYSHYNLQYQGI